MENSQFIIDFNPDCLERPLCRMRPILTGSCRYGLFDDRYQFSRVADGLLLPFPDDKFSNTAGPPLFPIVFDDTVQFSFTIRIDHIVSTFPGRLIHPHIERSVLHIRKPPFRRIQLITRHPQVKHNAVNRVYMQLVQNLSQIPEILLYRGKMAGCPFHMSRSRCNRILILIKSDQCCIIGQTLCQYTGMAAASQCAIHIYTMRVAYKMINCFIS